MTIRGVNQEVFRAISTNGRWGIAVVAETKVVFPAKGKLTSLGTFEGVKTSNSLLTKTVNGSTSVVT